MTHPQIWIDRDRDALTATYPELDFRAINALSTENQDSLSRSMQAIAWRAEQAEWRRDD